VECLTPDREEGVACDDFPAAPWGHMRTTNPIEATGATVRARTEKTRGCLSRVPRLAMVCKRSQSAATRWHRLRAAHSLTEGMQGVAFQNGLRGEDAAA